MKTPFSNPKYAEHMLKLHEQRMKLNPPAIPFARQSQAKKQKKKHDGGGGDKPGDDNSKTKTLKLLLDPRLDNSPPHTHTVIRSSCSVMGHQSRG